MTKIKSIHSTKLPFEKITEGDIAYIREKTFCYLTQQKAIMLHVTNETKNNIYYLTKHKDDYWIIYDLTEDSYYLLDTIDEVKHFI